MLTCYNKTGIWLVLLRMWQDKCLLVLTILIWMLHNWKLAKKITLDDEFEALIVITSGLFSLQTTREPNTVNIVYFLRIKMLD